MKLKTMVTTTSAAALMVVLGACGSSEEAPSVVEPDGAAQEQTGDVSPSAALEEPAESTDEDPAAESEPPTEEPAEPTDEDPAGDLPREPTAYVEQFLAAIQSDDTDLAVRLGPADGFAGVEGWRDLTAGAPELEDGSAGDSVVTVPFEEGGRLQLWVDEALIEAQADHGITAVVFEQ